MNIPMKYIYQSYNICINHSILLLFFPRIFYFIIPHLFISLALYINKPHSFPSCFHFHLLYSNEAWLSKDSDQRNSTGIALNHWINDFQHIGGWRWVTRRLITCCGPNQEDYAILLSPRSLKISDTGPENINPLFFLSALLTLQGSLPMVRARSITTYAVRGIGDFLVLLLCPEIIRPRSFEYNRWEKGDQCSIMK